ncbi:MAG: acyltransferase [Bacteroidetes bacterium]|nr:acyltransferase [Bacteroidota bacterium]
MKLKYIKELDSVRGLAALSIMWLHFAGTITPSGSVSSFFMKTASVFQTGVPLFFVLSGFLITRILLNSKSDTNYFSSFYMRRALRIFPLYYFVFVAGVYALACADAQSATCIWRYMGKPFVSAEFCHHFPLAIHWATTYMVACSRGAFLPDMAHAAVLLQHKEPEADIDYRDYRRTCTALYVREKWHRFFLLHLYTAG